MRTRIRYIALIAAVTPILIALFGFDVFAADDANPTALYEDLCQIRKLFCGAVGMVIVTFVITTIAISIFLGKFSWNSIIVTLVGLALFIGAENFMNNIFTPPPGSKVVEKCSC